MSYEDFAPNLKKAVEQIRKHTGCSTAAAQTLLHRLCLSGHVRSRGSREFNTDQRKAELLPLLRPFLPMPPLLSADDWRDRSINLDTGTLDGPNKIYDVRISAEDLEWWLLNEWKADITKGVPASSAHGAHRFIGSAKEEAWKIASEILKGDQRPERGRGRLTALARLVRTKLEEEGCNRKEDSICKAISRDFRAWETKNPDK
jgi:hypothetical protein